MADIYTAVEHNTISIDAGDTASLNNSISGDVNKAVPEVYHQRYGGTGANDNRQFNFDIEVTTGDGNFDVTRGVSGNAVTLELDIIIYDTAQVTIQTVTYSRSSVETVSVTIGSTAIANSFVINSEQHTSGSGADQALSERSTHREIDTATTVEIGGDNNSTATGRVYVMEAQAGEFSVQHINSSYTTAGTKTDTITAVASSRTMVMGSFSNPNQGTNDNSHNSNTVRLDSTTTVVSERDTGSSSATKLRHSVVEFAADQAVVQRITSSSVDATVSNTISSVTLAKTKAHFPSGYGINSLNSSNASGDVDTSYITAELTSATNLDTKRGDAATGLTVRYDAEIVEVIDNSGAAAGDIAPILAASLHSKTMQKVRM